MKKRKNHRKRTCGSCGQKMSHKEAMQRHQKWSKQEEMAATLAKGKSVPANKIDYYYNDPTTPTLKALMTVPPANASAFKFTVSGYKGGGSLYASDAGRAAECFAAVANSIAAFRTAWGSSPTKWAATMSLSIQPKSGRGNDLNAYYDRRSLAFLWQPVPAMKRTVYASSSPDIVTHELGHALLDAVKPQLWNLTGLEYTSFHEAFADINALLSMLTYSDVRNFVLKETKNDISVSNVASKLAEEFGLALAALGYDIPKGDPLRNAVNDYQYVNPSSLPDDGDYDELTAECHSFSRVFLGAFWDVLNGIYGVARSRSGNPATALALAVTTARKYLYYAVKNAALTNRYFASIGTALCSAAGSMDEGVYSQAVSTALTQRGIVTASRLQAKYMSSNHPGTVSFRLKDKAGKKDNPLYGVEVEMPANAMPFLAMGRSMLPGEEEASEEEVEHLKRSLDHLHSMRLVKGEGLPKSKNPVFEVVDNKLTRFRVF